MNCEQVFNSLSAYMDGELAPGERAAFDLHIAGCEQCAKFGQEFFAVVRGLKTAPLVEVPKDLCDRIGRSLEPKSS